MTTFISNKNVYELNDISDFLLLIPTYSSQDHYLKNRISVLHLYDFKRDQDYIISIYNKDIECVDEVVIQNLFDSERTIIAYDSKYITRYYGDVVDADHIHWYYLNKKVEVPDIYYPLIRLYDRYANSKDYFAITKIVERGTTIINTFKGLYRSGVLQIYLKNYRPHIHSFLSIELNKIKINTESEYCDLDEEFIYNDYNFCTSTGRPTSVYDGLNLMSLRKDSTRELIVPKFDSGRLFEMDYMNYHPSILANLIGYEYTERTIYQQIAKDMRLGMDSYDDIKQRVFSTIYGSDVKGHHGDHEFFKLVREFRDTIYTKFCNHELYDPSGNRLIFPELFLDREMGANKLLSYYIQMFETYLNSIVIGKIQHYLLKNNYRSEIILYLYDSLLIDYHPNDQIEVIHGIVEIMQMFGHKVSIKAGNNYKDMVTINFNVGDHE